jgi:hypothetical protein
VPVELLPRLVFWVVPVVVAMLTQALLIRLGVRELLCKALRAGVGTETPLMVINLLVVVVVQARLALTVPPLLVVMVATGWHRLLQVLR